MAIARFAIASPSVPFDTTSSLSVFRLMLMSDTPRMLLRFEIAVEQARPCGRNERGIPVRLCLLQNTLQNGIYVSAAQEKETLVRLDGILLYRRKAPNRTKNRARCRCYSTA